MNVLKLNTAKIKQKKKDILLIYLHYFRMMPGIRISLNSKIDMLNF